MGQTQRAVRRKLNACERRRSATCGLDAGFTLVEILIAIVLVGILSAVVVVGISNLTNKGAAAACAASADAATTASAVYFGTNQSYPTTLTQMTSAVPPMMTLPTAVTLNVAAVGSNAPGSVATGSNWTLTMVPGPAGGPPTFTCGGASAAPTANGTPACPGTFAGWVGEYYSTIDLTGSPAVCRDDPAVNFDWNTGGPAAGMPTDNFSARWTQTMTFTAGPHTFTLGSDDGSRLFIDGTKVLDYWSDHGYGVQTITQTLTAGAHLVVVEFYERGGYARATLTWI